MHVAHRAHFLARAALGLAAAWLVAASPAARAQAIAAGGDHACALTAAGGAVCWGENGSGELGDGTLVDRAKPFNVAGLPFGSTALGAGLSHSCAITSVGAVYCWGLNADGQLGDGTSTQRLLPTPVSGLGSGIASVVGGSAHTCARSTGGGVKCWGKNNNGQAGDGSAPFDGSGADKLTAVDVSGITSGATAIAAGQDHACAVVAMGEVKCWGANFFNQLGQTTVEEISPAPVSVLEGMANLTGASAVAAGAAHSCALTGGTVKCWGLNNFGQVGDGTNTLAETAVNVVGLSGVTAITAGDSHTCALTGAGAVKCWGTNAQGQVGDGTTTARNAPVDVIASGIIAIAAGRNHTCALSGTGMSVCWGVNVSGQVGYGAVGGPSYTPVATVYPTATSTALGSSANPSVFGDGITLTATVTGGATGALVAFRDGGNDIAGCGGQALASGTATCATTALQGGARALTAVYLGNADTLASTSGTLTQTVNPAPQTITFDPLGDKADNDPDFTVAASASSGLAVTFVSDTPSVCTVTGNTVDLLIAGTCTIAAEQAGNANYQAATRVPQSFTVASSGPMLALVAVQSRKTHGGAGDFDVPITTGVPIGGAISVEPRAIGTGHRVVFQFNIAITATGTVSAIDTMSNPIGTANAAMSGNDVVVTLTGIPDNRRVTVSLANVNGTGVSPSVSLGFLVGDSNGSRVVNITDVNGTKVRSGQAASAANFRFDANASGVINITDINAVKIRSGQAL